MLGVAEIRELVIQPHPLHRTAAVVHHQLHLVAAPSGFVERRVGRYRLEVDPGVAKALQVGRAGAAAIWEAQTEEGIASSAPHTPTHITTSSRIDHRRTHRRKKHIPLTQAGVKKP